MNIWIGNDHGGVVLKEKIVAQLKKDGHNVKDIGSNIKDIVRYPYYAAEVARAVADGTADRGILICSTGIGMSICANKFPGIRAANCNTTTMAKMTRLHNDSNILCLGEKILGEWDALYIVDTWLNTEYEGNRHDISLNLIAEAEQTNMSGNAWVPTGEWI